MIIIYDVLPTVRITTVIMKKYEQTTMSHFKITFYILAYQIVWHSSRDVVGFAHFPCSVLTENIIIVTPYTLYSEVRDLLFVFFVASAF